MTVIGEWEKVYAVVYHDGVDDVEIFADEWHTCSYGEATPAFEAVDKLVREGYLFTGWDLAVAETLTERADYYAQWAVCEHENFEYTENWEASGAVTTYDQVAGNDYQHNEHIVKHHEAKCLDCGALFSYVYETSDVLSDHTYVNGKCTQCAYACSHADKTDGVCDACGTEIVCDHLNKTEVETGVYKLAADSKWTPDNEGYHVGMAQIGTLYHCGECNKNLFVPLEDVKEYRFKCEQDENEDGKCDVCSGKILDETAPKFILIGLEPATGIVGCEVKVIAQFTDETELGCYKLYINDVLADEGELSGLTGEMAFTTTELAVGEHYFKLEVYDAADNCSKYPWPNPVTITAANAAPVIEDIDSTAGNTFKVGTEVTFSTKVTDDYGLSKIELYVDGKIEQTTAVGEKMFPVSFTTDELTVGEHTVRVVAEDKDGLMAEKSLTVTVVPCAHEDSSCTGNSDDTLNRREAIDDYQHMDYFTIHDEMKCNICGEVFIKDIDKNAPQNHAYVNGKCTECEHVCQHPAWNGNVCDACEHVCVHESWNEDGTCAKCGTACEHPTIRPDDETITDKVYGEADPIPLEENKAVRNERHLRYYTEMADYYCETCSVFVKKDQVSGYESEAHAFGEDHACDLCGYEKLHITRQPENTWAYVGENAMFTVEAVGNELTYTWYYKNASASSFSESSVKAASIGVQMTEARDGRQMYCVVKDKYGNTVKTDTVVMTLGTKLEITKQPVNAWADDGESAKVSVTATGDGLTYQWYYKNVGDEDFTPSTTKTASYSLNMNAERDGREVYCEVIDAHGNILKFDIVTLDTRFKPVITKQPVSVTASDEEDVSFSIEATGDGLTYQWEYKKPGSDTWTESSTGTTATYSFTMKDTYDGRQIRCIITDKYDDTVISNAADLTLAPPPIKITNQPDDAIVSAGDTAKFTVAAEGNNLTYQWQYKKSGSSTWSTASSTSTAYSFTMKDTYDDRSIRCVITDGDGNMVTSSTASLNLPVVTITSQPKSASVAVGDKATFTIKATGDGLEYQWQYKKSGSSTWSTASSKSTTYSFTMKESYDNRSIRCKVKDAYGNTVTSSSAKLTLE